MNPRVPSDSLRLSAMRAGRHNGITDVGGIRVGHCTRDEPGWLTGVSVLLLPPGTVGGVDVRGGGPGTRETDLLDPRNLVDRVDALVLAGGSAFGLAAADGVLTAAYADGLGWPVGQGEQRVPIVPAAILFDLGRAGSWLHHPGPMDGAAAYAAATDGPIAQGSVGAGTGARAGGLRGGLGSASLRLDSGHTVAALVVCNAIGSPVDLVTGELTALARGLEGEFDGIPEPDPMAVAAYADQLMAERAAWAAGSATTLAVVATDATLTKAQCSKLAGVAHDGFARALSPVHTAFDGDTVFAVATGAQGEPTAIELVDLQTAAADCVTRAIGHAMLTATSVDRSADGGIAMRSWADALGAR